MKILMVASEAVPFVKTGGLADVVSALSSSLKKNGHDVRIVIPRYYQIDKNKLKAIQDPMAIHINANEYWTQIYQSFLPETDVPVYFIDHEECFGRDGIYGSKEEPDFKDNPKRFSVLAHGALQLCRKLNWIPDIIHSHDWVAALVSVLLKFNENNGDFAHTASILTIHNIGYQGIYDKYAYSETGLDWLHFYATGFEDWDKINFLKAGLTSADKLTTVSPTYAKEIQRPEYGFRMDGILRYRSTDLVGILNGVDTDIWNPAKDPLIPHRYSAQTLHNKAKNKATLQKRMGLAINPDIPVFGMVTRLAEQKGTGELFGPAYGSAFKICTEMKIQLVVLGSGEHWCEAELQSLAQRLDNLAIYIGYNEELSHLIEAGSDFFLMPSRYEPCGLNQMYSLLYGTLPIVRATGGLADTVENYNEQTGNGTGFMLDHLSPESIYDVAGWATYAWYNKKEHIRKMQIRAMSKDLGWNNSATKYLTVYKAALATK